MAIKRKKKGGRVYLEEYRSVRVDGKVKSIYVRSLGPETPVEPPKRPRRSRAALDRLEIPGSTRSGDVTLLWELARRMRFVEVIDDVCCADPDIEGPSPGKILTAWAINRMVDPKSATQLPAWLATTDLPRLMGLSPADFTKDSVLEALDFVCYEDRDRGQVVDRSDRIDDALFRHWRTLHPLDPGESETMAYDLTAVLFFGVTCPLAELGYNPRKEARRQVNLALVVSRREKMPFAHFLYEGSRNGQSTVDNLIVHLQEAGVEPGTLIWDRGNVSDAHVRFARKAGWHVICGIPKTSDEIKALLASNDVPLVYGNMVRVTGKRHIYARKVRGPLYGEERDVVLYVNREHGVEEASGRHEALFLAEGKLRELASKPWSGTEKELREKAKEIVKGVGRYVRVRVKRTGDRPVLTWSIRSRELRKAEDLDGRFAVLCTDPSLSAREVVDSYLEKDFIEKVFRTMKSSGDLEPVRHRLEWRVRASIFVDVLAYRLQADLQHRLSNTKGLEKGWERPGPLLRELSGVQRIRTRLGHQVKTWQLNVSGRVATALKKLGFADLLESESPVELDIRP